jgi:hypothetical protein
MVSPIEEQIHQFLIEQEEQRCRALEIEYNKNKETKGKIVKRKKISKPWRRPGEKALCQDDELLIMVDEYDYDLSNGKFREYCLARGVLHVAGEEGTRRWEYFVDYSKPKSDYLKDAYFQLAEEMNGKRYRYTSQQMETGWKIIILGRARLQDCWELYSKELSD